MIKTVKKRGGIGMKRAKNGFSTLEVLLVLTILLLIASFAVPAVWKKVDEAHDAAAITTLHGLESVYRITYSMLVVEDAAAGRGVLVGRVHIPLRQRDAASRYSETVARQISLSYGGAPPRYEITETTDAAGTAYEIAVWPDPEARPEDCYYLSGGGVYHTKRAQPESVQR